ncbi:WXG100 family type VII secretion target [Streptomyces sp. OZ13]|uniref:WXG100 family type VII secretion target n=1 Tax=Streptomyces sp. OZ13 TaxID=3452210 RepID=UPI003F8B2046
MAEPSEGGGVVMPPLGILGLFFGTTDFESKTHEQMLAMVKAANPETLKNLSDQLTDAGKTITEIGEDLRAYIKGVRWEGEAGKAMETWGDQAWKATLQLGTYSTVGGTWIGNAAQTLREVKANLPEKDATAQANYDAAVKYRNDPDSEDIRREAWSKMTEDHAQAVQQMNKLAQSYSFSTFVISAAEPPTFPPPPGEFVPPEPRNSRSIGGTADRSIGMDRGTVDQYVPASNPDSKGGRPDSTTVVQTDVIAPKQERPVEMGIDSLDTLPPQTQLPPTPVGPSPTGRPETNVLPPVVGIPPTQMGKTVGPASAPPGGGKGFPNARNVVPPSGGGINSRMPRDSGITGGRPVAPSVGRPTGGIPRTNVIGGEGNARGPMGRGMGHMPGMPGGPTGAGQSGAFSGRRLASESGGVIGGRPPQAGQAGARPFTAGGSGLVRGTPAGGGAGSGQVGRTGAMGAGTNSSGRRRDDERGERPDYLSEDDETWQQGTRRVVPPVID